jgi:hypothetical protein
VLSRVLFDLIHAPTATAPVGCAGISASVGAFSSLYSMIKFFSPVIPAGKIGARGLRTRACLKINHEAFVLCLGKGGI